MSFNDEKFLEMNQSIQMQSGLRHGNPIFIEETSFRCCHVKTWHLCLHYVSSCIQGLSQLHCYLRFSFFLFSSIVTSFFGSLSHRLSVTCLL